MQDIPNEESNFRWQLAISSESKALSTAVILKLFWVRDSFANLMDAMIPLPSEAYYTTTQPSATVGNFEENSHTLAAWLTKVISTHVKS